MSRRPPLAALPLIALAAIMFVSCKSSSGGSKTPSPPVTAGATSAASPGTGPTVAPGAIRALDLKAVPDVRQLLADTGGEYVQTDVIYADLTGDGVEEAVVPVSSGGTLGNIAFIVLAVGADGGVSTLLREVPSEGRGLALSVEAGKLVETQPVPGPDDPECCPSQLKKTTYAWDGSALKVESVTTEANPAGGAKGTPSLPVTPGVSQ